VSPAAPSIPGAASPRPARSRRAPAPLVAALALAACGPYANLAQKLDVTARVAGDTWIAAAGADRTEIRVLVVGRPDGDGFAPFSFAAMQFPISRGSAATMLQGTWSEAGAAGATTLQVAHSYVLPEESSVGILGRRGTWRDDAPRTIKLTVTRDAGRLVVAGDPAIAATYVALDEALGRLGAATERDAACAFQIANLGIRSSEARIIGFGGPGMTQYQQAETYIGTLAGSLRVSMTGFTSNRTTIEYAAFVDLGGVRVDGPQITEANSGGDGHMSGVLSFSLASATSGTPPVTGTIDYGGAGDAAAAVQISNGNAVGGVYVTALDGGGTARVSPATPPAPSVAECLALP
jgi:hypothetical protein